MTGIQIRKGLRILIGEGVDSFIVKFLRHQNYNISAFRIGTLLHSLSVNNYASECPDETIQIPVDRLDKLTELDQAAFNPVEYRGAIVSGRWDKNGVELSKSSSMRKINEIDAFPTKKEARSHFQEVGKDPPSLFYVDEKLSNPKLPSREEYSPSVNITRDGSIQINSGHLQFAMAHKLGLKSVPVRVAARHQRWQYFKDQIQYFNRKWLGAGVAYNQIPHPDYSTQIRGESQKRFELMEHALQTREGTLLDIGSHIDGYFCHKFEDIGFDCYAVENHDIRAWLLEKIKNINGKKFKIINEDITKSDVLSNQFSVCLALNIFHHFLKDKEMYSSLIDVLDRINANTMFFQAHTRNQLKEYRNAGYKWHKTFVEDEFAEFIVDNSAFTSYELLGRPHVEDRPLYMLTKNGTIGK